MVAPVIVKEAASIPHVHIILNQEETEHLRRILLMASCAEPKFNDSDRRLTFAIKEALICRQALKDGQ